MNHRQGLHQHAARLGKLRPPYHGGAPPPRGSILEKQGKTAVLPVLPHTAPLVDIWTDSGKEFALVDIGGSKFMLILLGYAKPKF